MLEINKIGRFDGRDILEAHLQHGNQRVTIMNYGCVIRDWQVACTGGVRHVVLGFNNFEPYPEHSPSFGIIAGRVANRTALGRFTLDGQEYQLDCNNGKNHLHGGAKGFGKSVWNMQVDTSANAVLLKYLSTHNEQGYPGNVDFGVKFSLDAKGLHCLMQGSPDRPTPINLTQHNYYNLDGVGGRAGSIRKHSLQIDAEAFLPVDDELIPLGEINNVKGSRFDFLQMRTIEDSDPQQLGHDHNLVLCADRVASEAAATLRSSDAELSLELFTDQPGIQLYTGKKLDVAVAGHNGAQFSTFGGVCLEPQGFPDALNNPHWPSVIVTPEQAYKQNLTMRITGRS